MAESFNLIFCAFESLRKKFRAAQIANKKKNMVLKFEYFTAAHINL